MPVQWPPLTSPFIPKLATDHRKNSLQNFISIHASHLSTRLLYISAKLRFFWPQKPFNWVIDFNFSLSNKSKLIELHKTKKKFTVLCVKSEEFNSIMPWSEIQTREVAWVVERALRFSITFFTTHSAPHASIRWVESVLWSPRLLWKFEISLLLFWHL